MVVSGCGRWIFKVHPGLSWVAQNWRSCHAVPSDGGGPAYRTERLLLGRISAALAKIGGQTTSAGRRSRAFAQLPSRIALGAAKIRFPIVTQTHYRERSARGRELT